MTPDEIKKLRAMVETASAVPAPAPVVAEEEDEDDDDDEDEGASNRDKWGEKLNNSDVGSLAKTIGNNVDDAEGCETVEDLIANLQEARDNAKLLIKEINSFKWVPKK